MNAHYENMSPDEAVRPICAAAADGHHSKLAYDDVPICLACLALWTEELTGDGLADWARQKFIERVEASKESRA
jgi:hypothetical protein